MTDFFIYYTNSKDEIYKFHVKNMLDSDEREKIPFLEDKVKPLLNIADKIFYVLLIISICSIIVSLFWMMQPQDGYSSLYSIICSLLLGIVCFCLRIPCDEIFLKHYIKRYECEFLLQYLKDCSSREWGLLKHKIYAILSLLDAKTPEGTLFSEDLPKQAAAVGIVFEKTSFKVNWISYAGNGDQIQRDELFNIEHVIKNCKLEKDVVEYDVMKNELRVPVEFDIVLIAGKE